MHRCKKVERKRGDGWRRRRSPTGSRKTVGPLEAYPNRQNHAIPSGSRRRWCPSNPSFCPGSCDPKRSRIFLIVPWLGNGEFAWQPPRQQSERPIVDLFQRAARVKSLHLEGHRDRLGPQKMGKEMGRIAARPSSGDGGQPPQTEVEITSKILLNH